MQNPIYPNGKHEVREQYPGRSFGVYLNGKLVEGGFFSRGAALDCAENRDFAINGRKQ